MNHDKNEVPPPERFTRKLMGYILYGLVFIGGYHCENYWDIVISAIGFIFLLISYYSIITFGEKEHKSSWLTWLWGVGTFVIGSLGFVLLLHLYK